MQRFKTRLAATWLVWITAILFAVSLVGHSAGWLPSEALAALSREESPLILFALVVALFTIHLLSDERVNKAYLVTAGIIIGMGLFAGLAVGILWPSAGPLLKAGGSK